MKKWLCVIHYSTATSFYTVFKNIKYQTETTTKNQPNYFTLYRHKLPWGTNIVLPSLVPRAFLYFTETVFMHLNNQQIFQFNSMCVGSNLAKCQRTALSSFLVQEKARF